MDDPQDHPVARLAALSFEVLIAILVILAGVGQLFTGADPAVTASLAQFWTFVWAVSYLISGAVTITGITLGSYAIEGAGVSWMTAGVAIHAVTVLASGVPIYRMVPYVAAVGAGIARIITLWRGLDVAIFKRGSDDQ